MTPETSTHQTPRRKPSSREERLADALRYGNPFRPGPGRTVARRAIIEELDAAFAEQLMREVGR